MMKRLQIMIDEDLDRELGRLARIRRTSKAALIREYVREHLRPTARDGHDPLLAWAGGDSFEPEHHDDVVYSR